MGSYASESTSLQPIDLEGDPAVVARSLRHLPGLVYFDSSGNLPSDQKRPLSIVAARPVEEIVTHSDDFKTLELALSQYQQQNANEHGLPDGAACGTIDYDGSAHFGIYEEILIYDHSTHTWWERGRLSSELLSVPPAKVPLISEFSADMDRQDFLDIVARAKDYIAAGDIYQVNLAQKFSAHVESGSLYGLYEQLRHYSPAPMSAYMDCGGRQILSSSPELFLRFSGRSVETRPIKGTRPRFPNAEADQRSAHELMTSEKEIAELVMITDLLRNDLGQVSEFGSVFVEQMLKLESLQQVHHLVSTVKGTLRKDVSQLEALASCLPGGSITGAPKKRATEIIAELEPSPRGLYTGVIGFIGFNGESQFNIVIRSLIEEQNTLSYHVGAGIVADSDPAAEYEETLHKAAGIELSLKKAENLKA